MYLSLHSQLRQIYTVLLIRLKALERHSPNSLRPYLTLAETTHDQLKLLLDDQSTPHFVSTIQCFHPCETCYTDEAGEHIQPWLETICGCFDHWLKILTNSLPDQDKNSAECLILAEQVQSDLAALIDHFTPSNRKDHS